MYGCFRSICTLFDDQTEVDPELVAAVELNAAEEGGQPFDWLLVRTAAFRRRDNALLACWYAADLHPEKNGLTPSEPQRLALKVTHAMASRLDRPVLINPVSHRIYDLEVEATGTGVLLNDLPLADYPLFVAERAAVPELLEPFGT